MTANHFPSDMPSASAHALAQIDGFALAILHELDAAPPPGGMSLPRIGKRLQLGASVVLRQLTAMSAARVGGRDGPGWVRIERDEERWVAFITEAGRGQYAQWMDWIAQAERQEASPMSATLAEAAVLPLAPQRVRRFERARGQVAEVDDVVAAEVPVALVFNGISHAVMMATPQDLEDFALGFALSEGLIDTPADCRGIDVAMAAPQTGAGLHHDELPEDTGACEVHLEIATHCFVRLKDKRRALAGRTGCGVCGIDSLQGLDLLPEQVAAPAWLRDLSVDTVLDAFGAMPGLQALNARAGAVHAAGWALPDGTLTDVLEDVGRHNALDKLIGRLARTGRLRFGEGGVLHSGAEPALAGLADGFVVMSSRASYELVRKCARLQIPALATISAPTSLAIGIARQAGMQLWGFCRDPRARRYA